MNNEAKKDKAYKLLALQIGTSNNKAKELIDKGLVYVGNKKVKIARADIGKNTTFRVEQIDKVFVIFEDENLIAVDKPAFVDSYDLEQQFKGTTLFHRLDKETSGVLVLTKTEEFRTKAIKEFIDKRVYKEYTAWVEGIIYEEEVVDKPIKTIKGHIAKSKISKDGKEAKTSISPILAINGRSKVKLVIDTGRTHQIRVHLQSINHSVVGDEQYGGRGFKRMMLHSAKMDILGYHFQAQEPKIFQHFVNS